MKVLYYDRSLSIKTGIFTLDPQYKFINLSLLSPAKVETIYTKEFISNAGFIQGIILELIDKANSEEEDLDESIEDYSYHMYKNIEFTRWREDSKRPKEDVSSILDSLNESRDDSINSSIFLQDDDISAVPKDTQSDLGSHMGFTGKSVSSITGGKSEIDSVFKMGTEQWMGSEKHTMIDNVAYQESNAGKNT